MPETEGLDRKRKVRAAHRGSATRIMNQVAENLGSPDGPNLPRLKQQKTSLAEKMEVLCKLDNELIEMVDEEELDHEVGQADIIREKIGVCIIDIDEALARTESLVRVGDSGGATPRRDSAGGVPTIGPIPVATPTDATHAPPTVATIEPFLDPVLVSTPSSDSEEIPEETPATETTVASVAASVLPTAEPLSLTATPRVKLPKLSIKKFGGDLMKWVSFWDSFESSIHQNSLLSNIDKFNYLNSFLESTASESIAG